MGLKYTGWRKRIAGIAAGIVDLSAKAPELMKDDAEYYRGVKETAAFLLSVISAEELDERRIMSTDEQDAHRSLQSAGNALQDRMVALLQAAGELDRSAPTEITGENPRE